MELIQQLDRTGCVVACLAMLTGCDYYEMRKRLDNLNNSFPNFLPQWGKPEFNLKFYPKEVREVLLQLKIRSEYVKWYEDEDRNDNNSAHILLISPVNNPQYSHAVMYHNQMIYDPMENKPQPNNLENFNVYSCIRIIKEYDNG